MSVWAWTGAALAVLAAFVALVRARATRRTVYESEIYGLGARSHARFALVSAAFAVVFLLAAFVPAIPPVPILALYSVVLILYAASFARGATEAE